MKCKNCGEELMSIHVSEGILTVPKRNAEAGSCTVCDKTIGPGDGRLLTCQMANCVDPVVACLPRCS